MKKEPPPGTGMLRSVAIRHKSPQKGCDFVAITQKKNRTEIFETMSVPKALAVMAIPPTDRTNWRSPTPAAPIREEMYTWKAVPANRSSRLTPVSRMAL